MQVGDLVTLFRRTNPGLGIIMEHVPDISVLCDHGEKDIEELVDMWNEAIDYSERNKALNHFLFYSRIDRDLGSNFLMTNGFYKYSVTKVYKEMDTVKLSFIKVMWICPPSDYNIRISRKKIQWYPAKWARIPKIETNPLTE